MIKATDLPPIPDYSIAHPSPPAPTWKYLMPVQPSIDLRDWFAGMAMQALLPDVSNPPDEHWKYGVALDAYAMADAMLKARETK